MSTVIKEWDIESLVDLIEDALGEFCTMECSMCGEDLSLDYHFTENDLEDWLRKRISG